VVPLAGGVTMTGLLTLSGAPTNPNHAATKAYADGKLSDAPLDGFYYGRASAAWGKVVPIDGSIAMTGLLTLSGAPTSSLHAATKDYADTKLSDAPTDGTTYGRKNGAWSAVASGANVYVQDTAPVGATAGSLWWQSSTGLLFVYYNDGTSTQWVYASGVATVPILRSYLAGLTLSTAGSSATFAVAPGQCADSSNSDMLTRTSVMSKTTGAWAVGNGNGALDASTIAINTWYHVFLIKRPDTQVVDVLISLSTSPALPTNYTLFRRIGSMKTNASSQWTKFIQFGDEFLWDAPTTDINVSNPGTTGILRTLNVPTGVNVLALVNVLVIPDNSVTDSRVVLTCPDITDAAATNATLVTGESPGVASHQMIQQLRVRTNTSGQIRSRNASSSTNTQLQIGTVGWYDRRGQDS
jgi:hypothetical protein